MANSEEYTEKYNAIIATELALKKAKLELSNIQGICPKGAFLSYRWVCSCNYDEFIDNGEYGAFTSCKFFDRNVFSIESCPLNKNEKLR